ncbi:MAG: hypothetical protein AAFZ65_02250 [Planctomycetota bacterium]
MQRDWLATATLSAAAVAAVYLAVQGGLNLELLEERWGAGARPALAAELAGAGLALALAWRGWGGSGAACLGTALGVGFGWVAVQHLLLQPYHRFVVEASFGLACAVFAVLRVPTVRRRLTPPCWVFKAALALASAAVALELGLELAARVRPMPLLTTIDDDLALKVASQRFRPGLVRLGHPCNARGFYDDPFVLPADRSEPAIAFVGDSFVAGIVPHAFAMTTVLEQQLDGPLVFNLGVPAVGPDVYGWLIEHEALPLAPDLLLVGLFVGNDLTDAAYVSGVDALLRRLVDEDRYLTHVVFDRIQALRREGLPILAGHGESGLELLDATPEALAEALPWIADPRLEPPSFSEPAYLRGVRQRARDVGRPDPELLDELWGHLDRIRALAGEIPLGLVLFPTEFQVEDGLWAVAEAELRRRPEPFDRTAAQAAILDYAARHGLPALDLYPILRAQPALLDGHRHLYHLRDTHFNARGSRVAGRAIADFVATKIKAPR